MCQQSAAAGAAMVPACGMAMQKPISGDYHHEPQQLIMLDKCIGHELAPVMWAIPICFPLCTQAYHASVTDSVTPFELPGKSHMHMLPLILFFAAVMS